MTFSHLYAPPQSTWLVETQEKISSNKKVDTVFKTLNKTPHQLLKSLFVGMPKRVFEVNCKKMKFTLHIKVMCT